MAASPEFPAAPEPHASYSSSLRGVANSSARQKVPFCGYDPLHTGKTYKIRSACYPIRRVGAARSEGSAGGAPPGPTWFRTGRDGDRTGSPVRAPGRSGVSKRGGRSGVSSDRALVIDPTFSYGGSPVPPSPVIRSRAPKGWDRWVMRLTHGPCQQSGRHLVQRAHERDRSHVMKHRIVVLGAGYAGAFAAGNLARRFSPPTPRSPSSTPHPISSSGCGSTSSRAARI